MVPLLQFFFVRTLFVLNVPFCFVIVYPHLFLDEVSGRMYFVIGTFSGLLGNFIYINPVYYFSDEVYREICLISIMSYKIKSMDKSPKLQFEKSSAAM